MRDAAVVLARTRGSVLLLSLIAALLAGCNRAKKVAPSVAKEPASALTTVALVGANEVRGAVWTGDGDVVAWGGDHLFRMHPRDAARATRHFELKGVASAVGARAASTAAVLDLEEGVWSSRGDALDWIATVPGASQLGVSDDGFIVGVNGADAYWFFDALRGHVVGRVEKTASPTLHMAPSGRHVMDDRGVFVAQGEPTVPAYRAQHATPLGWVGDRAMFSAPASVAIYDAERARATSVQMPCEGKDHLDVMRARVVRVCDDRVVFVSLDKLARIEVPFRAPPGVNARHSDVLYAANGASVFIYLVGAGPPSQLEIDPERRAVKVVNEPSATRGARNEVGAGDTSEGPDGELLILSRGVVAIEDPRRHVSLKLGAKVNDWYLAPRAPFRARAGGVELTGQGSSPVPQVVRLGGAATSTDPPALPAPNERHIEGDGDCPFLYERRALADGREMRLATSGAAACMCDHARCQAYWAPFPYETSDAAKDVILQMSREAPSTKVRLVDLHGATLRSVEIPKLCFGGRISQDARSIALRCVEEDEIVELDFAELRVTRRTPLRAGSRAPLIAAGKDGFLFALTSTWTVEAQVIEAGTGVVRWSIGSLGDVVLARDARGVIDLPMGAAVPASLLVCLDGERALPFAACGPSFVTHGRLRFE